jgi:predicted dehydrogenase
MRAASPRVLTIGLIGYNFMGRAHSNAWRQAPRFFNLPAELRLKTICGRNAAAVRQAGAQLGWENASTEWQSVVADPEIDVIDICTPNDSHAPIAIAAAEAGKAILCEKPLARDVAEAEQMLAAAKKARVVNMLCYNYRRVPAISLAKQMIERGAIGDRIYHFRARYAQDWIADPAFPLVWRLQAQIAGSGANGDINAHVIDLARYLVGEFREVCATMRIFVNRRPLESKRPGRKSATKGRVKVDDALAVVGHFRSGALATLEATRFAHGRKNQLTFEINGSKGSLAFDLEDMNRLRFYDAAERESERGFRDIIVTEPSHPYVGNWWPPGHIIGYEHTFVHTIVDFVNAVIARKSAAPDFAAGLKTQRVLDAVQRSATTRQWITL